MKRLFIIALVTALALTGVLGACTPSEVTPPEDGATLPEEGTSPPEEEEDGFSEEFLAYIDMLKKTGLDKACEQKKGIDFFEENYIKPCDGIVPDGGWVLSVLYQHFGEDEDEDIFPQIAFCLYKEQFLSPYNLKEMSMDLWQYAGPFSDPRPLIAEYWKRERVERMGGPGVDGAKGPYPEKYKKLLLLIGEKDGEWATLVIKPAESTTYISNTHTVVAEMWRWVNYGTPRQDCGIPICPLAGQRVNLSVSGAHSISDSATTNGQGQATFAYEGTNFGDDEITVTTVVNGKELTVTTDKKW